MSTTKTIASNPNPPKWKRLWLDFIRWEYWPFHLLYAPILPYWIWLILKTRSLFFFTAANPGIEFGGMLGESKEKILRSIDPRYLPTTVKLHCHATAEDVLHAMNEAGLSFPVILKPDIGERGWSVEKISDARELEAYLSVSRPALLLQAFVDLPIELGVFYYRKPSMHKGRITSIVQKRLLAVEGDGVHTIHELMNADDRARRYTQPIALRLGRDMHRVPHHGERVELMPIGNHSRGTAFLNVNHEIDAALEAVFDEVARSIDGFHFGRFDLRCASFEELRAGSNFNILELNGAGAEPAHIYHPGSSLLSAYKDIVFHLNLLADIAVENMKMGTTPMTVFEGWRTLQGIMRYNRTYKT